MKEFDCGGSEDTKPVEISRRSALRSVGVATLGTATLSVGATRQAAADTTLSLGDRVTQRFNTERGCSPGHCFTDHNWSLGYVGKDEDTNKRYFANGFLSHDYMHVHKSGRSWYEADAVRDKVVQEVHLWDRDDTDYTEVDITDTSEGEEPLTKIQALNYDEWQQWYDENQGSSSTETEIRDELADAQWENDDEVPEWLQVMVFVGGVAAGGTGYAALSVGATAVDALLLAYEIGNKEPDDCGKSYDDNTGKAKATWDFCNGQAVTNSSFCWHIENSEPDSNLGVSVYQKALPSKNDDVDNVGHWQLDIPTDMDQKPVVTSRDTWSST